MGPFSTTDCPLAPISFMPVPGNHDLYNARQQADPDIEQIYRETWGATYYSAVIAIRS
jgi:3',5'-cyclic AMP phosphodiesterase CpdA